MILKPSHQSNLKEKIDGIKKLSEYKLCLTEEFMKDKDTLEYSVIEENEEYEINHFLFRKGLEPKYHMVLEVESEFLMNNLLSGSENS